MTYRAALLILLTSTILVSACGGDSAETTVTPDPTPLSAEEYFAQGVDHQSEGDLRPAVNSFTLAIDSGYPGVEAYLRRGLSSFELGQYQPAIDDFDRVISEAFLGVEDRSAEVYQKRALANVELGRYQTAIGDFDKTLGLTGDAETYFNRGLAKFKLGQNEGAITDFDQAVRRQFKNTDVYMHLGRAEVMLGNFQPATQYFGNAIDLNDQDAQAYFERGSAHSELENFQLAIDDYDKAIDLDPENADAYYDRGLAKLQLKQRDLAKEDFDDAIRLNPDLVEAYYTRGILLYGIDELKDAAEDFSKVIGLDPENIEAYRLRALSHFSLGNFQNTVDDLDQVISANRQDADAYFARGHAFDSLENFEAAIEDFDRVLLLRSGDTSTLYTRGYVHFKMGNSNGALEDYTELIDLDPGDADAHYNRRLVLFQQDEFQRAFTDFDRAATLKAGDAAAISRRGNASQNLAQPQLSIRDYLGQLEKAIADYSGAILDDPINVQAYLNRGNAHRVLGQLRALAYAELGNRQRDSQTYIAELESAIADYDQVLRLDSQNAEALANRGLAYLNVGKVTRGLDLEITVKEIKRISELRYIGGEETHYIVTPDNASDELVVLHIDLYNIGVDSVSLTLDQESAELRGFGPDQIHRLLDLSSENTANVQETSPDHAEDRYRPFLTGPLELLPGRSVRGWIAFQVPKGIRVKEMRWDAHEVIYLKMPPLELVLEDLNDAILIDPQLAKAYNYRSLAFSALGQFQLAVQDYGQAISLDPQYALAYANRGDANRNLGNIQSAIADYNQSVRVDPTLSEYHEDRGLSYSTSENTSKGDFLIIDVQEIARTPEVRYQGSDGQHRVIAPAGEGNELVAIFLNIYKIDDSTTFLTLDEDSVGLRGIGLNETFRLLDPTFFNEVNVSTVEEAHPDENLYLPFIAGSRELTQAHSSVEGWILFEAPVGTNLRELRWGTGEVLFLRLDQLQGAMEDLRELVQLSDGEVLEQLRNGRNALEQLIAERKPQL